MIKFNKTKIFNDIMYIQKDANHELRNSPRIFIK